MRTKARIRYKKQVRLLRQSKTRILEALSSDQRRIVTLSAQEYQIGEIARELALTPDYVQHFMTGLIQKLSTDHIIGSPDWRNVIKWAEDEGMLRPARAIGTPTIPGVSDYLNTGEQR